jgi:hypothetical protein
MQSRASIWSCLIAYVVFRYVEGISRIKKCSTSGRGVLIGDISAVYSILTAAIRLKYATMLSCGVADWVNWVVACRPSAIVRDKSYVDDYARAFYYDTEGDVQHWISMNKVRNSRAVCTDPRTSEAPFVWAQERYLNRHLKALLTNGIGATLKKKRLQELLATVDEMPTLAL